MSTKTRTKQITGAASAATLHRQALSLLREYFNQASESGADCSPGDMIVEISLSWPIPYILPKPTGEELDKLLATQIIKTQFGLSLRTATALDQAGYQIVGDVARQTGDTLAKTCLRFGDACLRDTRSRLALSGLHFGLKAPVGPLERRAALDGPAWAYLCPRSEKWMEIHRSLTAVTIHNLSDLIRADDEIIVTAINRFIDCPRAEVRAMRTRIQERGLID